MNCPNKLPNENPCKRNFPKSSVVMLQEMGYDISSIGNDCAGISDDEVMNIAISEERLIVTFEIQ